MDMPMETMQSPFVKAGPGEITTKMSEEDMRILMGDALGHVPYATGASNFMGSRLTTDGGDTTFL
ncbi:MAG: divergent polysaccharide deacetylase family protein [Bilophila wadsworthia]